MPIFCAPHAHCLCAPCPLFTRPVRLASRNDDPIPAYHMQAHIMHHLTIIQDRFIAFCMRAPSLTRHATIIFACPPHRMFTQSDTDACCQSNHRMPASTALHRAATTKAQHIACSPPFFQPSRADNPVMHHVLANSTLLACLMTSNVYRSTAIECLGDPRSNATPDRCRSVQDKSSVRLLFDGPLVNLGVLTNRRFVKRTNQDQKRIRPNCDSNATVAICPKEEGERGKLLAESM